MRNLFVTILVVLTSIMILPGSQVNCAEENHEESVLELVRKQGEEIARLQEKIEAIEFENLEESEYDDEFDDDFDDVLDLLDQFTMHGFISQGYMVSNHNNYLTQSRDGSYEFNEVGINISTDLTEDLRAGMQFMSRDLGKYGNNDVKLDWAFFDYNWRDWLGFRAGKMKISFGLYNETRDIDLLRTSILLPQSIYFEFFREPLSAILGFGLYGKKVDLDQYGHLNYTVQLGALNLDSESGVSTRIENMVNNQIDVTDLEVSHLFNSSLMWNAPIEGLRMGSAVYDTHMDIEGIGTNLAPIVPLPGGGTYALEGKEFDLRLKNLRAVVHSLEYAWNDLLFAAEYAHLISDNQLRSPVGVLVEDRLNMEGYYASVSYRFTDWFESGISYSIWYNNKNNRDGSKYPLEGLPEFYGWQKDLAISTRFDVTPQWLIKVEGHIMNGAALMLPSDNPSGMHEHWFLLLFKTSICF